MEKPNLLFKLRQISILMRPKQYIKNGFIFLPLFFAGNVEISVIAPLVFAFIGFSLVCSSVYVINDYFDKASDALHPTKRHRPLAAGSIRMRTAKLLFGLLFCSGICIVYFVNTQAFFATLTYFLINVLYSTKLKHVSLVDIFLISFGFVIRLYVGAFVASVPLSMWIVIMTFLLSLFLALAKRRDDLVILRQTGHKVRKSIDGYTIEFINSAMVIMASVTIVSYIMYTTSQAVIDRLHSNHVYLTSVFVIFGIVRYLQISLIEENSGSPTKIVLTDGFMQATILSWLGCFFWLLYC